MKKLSIVIPCYNEKNTLRVIIDAVRSVDLSHLNIEKEIVVVDDGSKDDTARVAKKSGATVIRHILNTGSGGATATGLSYAQQNGFDLAITLDADGQHSSDDVVNGIDVANKSKTDLLIGSRLLDSQGMSRVKVLGNKGLSFITYVIFGINATDSQSGLRVFSRKALEQLRWKTSGFEFCSEMLWRAKQIGLKIDEYPIKAIYTDYSKSKGQNNWNAFNIIKSLVKRRVVEVFGE